jgi:hypothetical protein
MATFKYMPLLLLALVLAAVAVPVRWQSPDEADDSALPAADSGNGVLDAADALFDSDGESDLAVFDDADESSVATMEVEGGPFAPVASCNNVAPGCPENYELKPINFNQQPTPPKIYCAPRVGARAGPITCRSLPNQPKAVLVQQAVCDPPPPPSHPRKI